VYPGGVLYAFLGFNQWGGFDSKISFLIDCALILACCIRRLTSLDASDTLSLTNLEGKAEPDPWRHGKEVVGELHIYMQRFVQA
jgi:hypothetical protein